MLRGWLLEPSARFSFVDGSSMAVRRCHGVTGSNGSWLSIRVCALSWRKRLTKDRSMTAPPCDLCSMKWFQATPLEPLWPMPSSTASATTGTSVNRLARRASFRLNEASRAGSFTECVRKCGQPSPPSFIVNAFMLRPSSAQSNANSQPKHRAVRSPRNANKRFYSAWPTTSISSGHFILDFHQERRIGSAATGETSANAYLALGYAVPWSIPVVYLQLISDVHGDWIAQNADRAEPVIAGVHEGGAC